MSDQSEETDKRKIYGEEKKFFIEWIKTICEKPLDDVKKMADSLVSEGKVSSIKALLCELSDGEGHKAIHFAVSRDHLDTVKWILENDPDSVNVNDDNGYSPLVHACIADLQEIITYLLDSGATLNPSTGVPALQMAVDKSSVETVIMLLKRGADVNLQTPQSHGTALHHVCAASRNELIPILITHHADVNCKDEQNLTPLLYAAVNTNAPGIRFLLNNSADPLATLPDGETPLHIVADAGHVGSVKTFIDQPSIHQTANAHDSKNETPIVYAARAQHKDVVELLLPFTEEASGKTVQEIMDEYKPKPQEKPKETTKENGAMKEPDLTAEQAVQLHQMKTAGVKLFNQSKWEEAKNLFVRALDIYPEDAVLHSNISSCYLRMHDLENAMKEAEECIRLQPKWARGYYRKGMVLFEKKEFVDAATTFYQGCELDPADKKLSQMFNDAIQAGKESYKENGKSFHVC